MTFTTPRPRTIRTAALAVVAAVVVGLVLAAFAGGPADPAARLEKARDLTFAGRPEAALGELRRALAELGEDGDPELRRRALARAAQLTDFHLGERRVNEALSWYRHLIEEFPQSQDAFDAGVRIAEILKQRFEDDARASAQLVTVVDAFPKQPGVERLLLRAARLASDARLYEEARRHANRLVETWSESDETAEAHALIAASFHLEGRHAEAVTAWEGIARRWEGTPEGARALAEAGHCLEEQLDLASAMARYIESLPQHPEPFRVQKSLERVRRKFVAERAKSPGSKAVAFGPAFP